MTILTHARTISSLIASAFSSSSHFHFKSTGAERALHNSILNTPLGDKFESNLVSLISDRSSPAGNLLNETVHIAQRFPNFFWSRTICGPYIFTAYHHENTLLQENSFYPISFDQKFGKPDLTQMRHEQNGCEKL